jgi:hypothetical protein
MKNKLYKEFASYYVAATNDRDFKNQLELILDTYDAENPCRSILELFAGQSLHSIEATKNPDMDVWAIDSSSEMKQIALAAGFNNPDKYIVGDLPEAILDCVDQVKFDCITCLYHGLSNLTKTAVFDLLNNCKKILNSNGKLFIELHDIFYMMQYIANPQIHYTEVENAKGEQIKYAWPSDKIEWDPYTFTAKVPVKFLVQSPQRQRVDTIEFTSTDHLYSTEDIVFLANLLGYNCRIMTTHPSWGKYFEKEIILELSIKQETPNF